MNLRIKLATQGDTYTQIIQELGFVERFGSIYGESSKAWPRGVTKDTPYPDLVMRKQHLILRSYTDEKVLSPDFFESIIHDCRTARPWMDWLQDV